MFDKYFTQKDRIHPVTTEVNIIEQKAPTDESLRLLDEMKDKLLNNFISLSTLSNNDLKLTWHIFNNPNLFNKTIICRIRLNNKDYKIEIEIPEYTPKDEIVNKIRENIIKELATIITLDMFGNHDIVEHIKRKIV